MIRTHVSPTYRVRAELTLRWPVTRAFAWQHMADLPRFATADIFHERIHGLSDGIAIGKQIWIDHAFGPVYLQRTGRLLRWREGEEYAFSDLSLRHPHRAFPHVYDYRLSPLPDGSTQLQQIVTGKWTATWMPRELVRCWLALVMKCNELCLRKYMRRTTPGK